MLIILLLFSLLQVNWPRQQHQPVAARKMRSRRPSCESPPSTLPPSKRKQMPQRQRPRRKRQQQQEQTPAHESLGATSKDYRAIRSVGLFTPLFPSSDAHGGGGLPDRDPLA